MTIDQRHTLDHDIGTVMESLGRIVIALRAYYNDEDQRVYRAEEARAAVQRLIWAIERS